MFLGGVYFTIKRKSTAGAILPSGEPDWLNWITRTICLD